MLTCLKVMRAQKRNALVSTGVSLISDTDEIETDETDNETDVSSSVSEDYVEREFRETYTEEVRCVCVKALYPYQAKTMSMNRGEVLELKERSTPEWWLVEKNSGIEAYVPATYLKGKQLFLSFKPLIFIVYLNKTKCLIFRNRNAISNKTTRTNR